MIIKTLTRKQTGTTGQLLRYILRYTATEKASLDKAKEHVSSRVISRADIKSIDAAYIQKEFGFKEKPNLTIAHHARNAEKELNAAVRIAKATAIGKEYVQRLKRQGNDPRQVKLFLSTNFLISRTAKGDQFFKLTTPLQLPAKAEKPQKEVNPFLVTHNLRSKSLEGWVREFEKIESLREHKRSNNISTYHHILSFSSKDKEHVTDEMLKDIAYRFIELRSPDSAFVIARHSDKDHIHLHASMSPLTIDGRSNRQSKAEFEKLKIVLDQYLARHYPLMENSLPDHGKKRREKYRDTSKSYIKTNDERTSKKEALQNVLQATFAQSKSSEQFIYLLQEQGYEPYSRVGQLTGITDGQTKWRLGRLGYTKEKLHSLDILKDQEEKQLAELRSLRESNTKSKTNDRLESIKEMEEGLAKEISEPDKNSSSQEISGESKDRDTDPSKEEEQSQEKNVESKDQDRDDRSSSDDDDRTR